ncbi:MAG: type IV pilus biogenesis protein PilM [Anaerolineae bacterium]
MFDRERMTLSIEATEVRLLVVRRQRLLRWDRLPLPAGVLRNGQVVQPTAFGQVIADLIERAKGPRRQAVVSLGGQGSLIRILSLPTVPPRLLGEAVQRAARRELPLPPEELYLSRQVVGDSSAPRLQVFILGVPREALDNCIIGLRSAGVRPRAMDLKPLALVRAVNLPDVLLADLEAETESVVLVRGFVPYIVRSAALPGEAEHPLDERAEHLVVEIQRTLDFYNSTTAAEHLPWPPVVCLTGALGGEEEVRARIEAHWPLVEPAPPLPLPEELPLLPYLVNVGLALKRLP